MIVERGSVGFESKESLREEEKRDAVDLKALFSDIDNTK
jgi:hypothetical protein